MSTVPLALIGPLGLPELLIIAAILMLLFGAKKLPELGRGMGGFVKNLKAGMHDKELPGEETKKLESGSTDSR